MESGRGLRVRIRGCRNGEVRGITADTLRHSKFVDLSGKIFRSGRTESRSADTERSGEVVGRIDPRTFFDAVDVEPRRAGYPRERDMRPRIRDHRSCAGVDSRGGTRVVGDVAVRA